MLSIARNVVSQQSPCPEIFQYETDGREKFGSVHIINIEAASSFVLEVKFIAKAQINDVSCFSEPPSKLMLLNFRGNPLAL